MINRLLLVSKMLLRGDELSIVSGRLDIRPASKKPVPHSWLVKNQEQIIKELAVMLDIDLLVYINYSTGRYENGHYPGINLQYQWMLSLKGAYVIFNADLKRARTTKSGKKGTPLPKRQFRVGCMSKFLKFWTRTGLKFPPRFSSFHDYMGNLKKLVFTADTVDGEKLDKDSIKPFNITASEVLNVYSLLTDNSQTNDVHNTDNSQTVRPDKTISQSHGMTGSERNLTTGDYSQGIRLPGNTDTSSNVILLDEIRKLPSEQTNEEWLADYNKND